MPIDLAHVIEHGVRAEIAEQNGFSVRDRAPIGMFLYLFELKDEYQRPFGRVVSGSGEFSP